MEVFDSVRTVLAVRQYQDKPLPPALIQRIVEAGRLTASSMNRQPWHFIVIENRATLGLLAERVHTGPFIAQASLAIVVAVEKTRFALSDASRAVQSMILTAWSEGVGSCWVGFLPLPEVNELLGIPDDLDVAAVIPFGYPLKSLGLGRKKRKPLSEVAHRERFGQPFE
jgi:nitroreductase